jgi:hypothetical protein
MLIFTSIHTVNVKVLFKYHTHTTAHTSPRHSHPHTISSLIHSKVCQSEIGALE